MQRLFQSFGRPLVFRLSPLAPPQLDEIFDARGWSCFDETAVMVLNIADARLEDAIPQLPLRDVGRWIDQSAAMGSFNLALKPGLHELIGNVQGEVGLFLMEDDAGTALAGAMAVRFGSLVGLFEVVSNPDLRRHGFGRRIIRSALLWGAERGATRAWLQVVAENEAAASLYRSEGFVELYRYAYRQAERAGNP